MDFGMAAMIGSQKCTLRKLGVIINMKVSEKNYRCIIAGKIYKATFYQGIILRQQYMQPCRIMKNIRLDKSEDDYDDAKDGKNREFWKGLCFLKIHLKKLLKPGKSIKS